MKRFGEERQYQMGFGVSNILDDTRDRIFVSYMTEFLPILLSLGALEERLNLLSATLFNDIQKCNFEPRPLGPRFFYAQLHRHH